MRLRMVCVWLAVTGAAWAQEPANALTSFQQNAAKRSAEWSTLAANLEQRVARLLPCDPRIRSAVEEVSRASEARIVALTTYWMAVSGKSKNQMDAIRRLMTQEEARKDEWTNDRIEAEQERSAVAEKNGFLAVSANRLPALAGAQQALTATAQAMRQIEMQIQERETTGDQFVGELRDLLTASQAKQSAIEAQLKYISAEGTRWSAYYAARLSRAQTECAVTNAGPAVSAPRSPARKAPATTGDKK